MTIQELEKLSPNNYMYYDVKDQLKRFIYNLSEKAFEDGDRSRDEITGIEGLEARKAFMHDKFIDSLGGLPSLNTPLNAVTLGIMECDGYSIEKVIFESRPKTYVTANLYVPNGIKSPTGAVLFLCGHHEMAKHEPEYQIVCQYLVRAGLVVLTQDPVGQGERFSYFEKSLNNTTIEFGVTEHNYVGSQCWLLGDSLARYFIHDAMRGIDYLCTRLEVDPSRIGVTGNSGGGTQTTLVMMCDPRIAAAAPATFIMNRSAYMHSGMAQDAEQIWPKMTAYGFDHEDLLLSMTPKPVLVLAVTSDFFPIEGTRRTVGRVKRFWKMYGNDSNLMLYEDRSSHHYTRYMAKTAAEFFSLHLLGKKVTPDDKTIKSIDPDSLWCTKSGQVGSELEDVRNVYEENCDRLSELEQQLNLTDEKERQARALGWLRGRVFFNRKTCDLNVRIFSEIQANDYLVDMCIWWSQEGIFNYALVFRDYRFKGKDIPVTIALWDDGSANLQPHFGWIRQTCSLGRAVMVLNVSGVGNIEPNNINSAPSKDFLGTIAKLTMELFWLGDSLAALRTYDVLRSLDAINEIPGLDGSDIQVLACGVHRLYGQLAAKLDNRINGVEMRDGVESFASLVRSRHYDYYDMASVIIPGILKYFDLPDIEKWI